MLRKTLSPQFWMHEFTVSEQNLDFLYGELADGRLGIPAPFEQLVISLIRECQRQEDSHVQKLLSLGTMYQPQAQYEVGQVLVFTALDYRTGTVTDIRPGSNPEHGKFQVVAVEMEESTEKLEFAAQLKTQHLLNALDIEELQAGELMTAEEIYEQYGADIAARLRTALAQTRKDSDFMEWRGGWLLKDMLVEIDEFSRNVTEALMFEKKGPVPGAAILQELKLDLADVEPNLVDLSLDVSLSQDGRFEQVMANGERQWYARSLLPDAARRAPALLTPVPIKYQFSALDGPLLSLEVQLQDEWSDLPDAAEAADGGVAASYHLLVPHLDHGTMPVSSRLAALLDREASHKHLLAITDALSGDEMACWYVPESRYVAGLGDFYRAHKLAVGARVTLQRKADGALTLDYPKRRGRKEWISVLHVADGTLHFTQEKSREDIASEFMPELLVAAGSETEWADYRASQQDAKVFLLVETIVSELAKGSGTVHAATVYSAVNLIQRHPPGPVFHALISNSRLAQLDDQVTFQLA